MFKVKSSFGIITLFLSSLPLIAVSQSVAADTGNGGEVVTQHYRVKDGKVDPQTFRGYTVYHSVCVACHGVGGSGAATAPSLVANVSNYSADEFQLKVLHKYAGGFSVDDWQSMEKSMLEEIIKEENPYGGDLSEMPRWQNNEVVNANVYNIYRYLRARADGVIDEGKPGLWK